jgi:predicted outer membrane protein
MIDDHKGDISDFTKEAKSDAPSDVKALARDALPDLQKHLDMAKRLT